MTDSSLITSVLFRYQKSTNQTNSKVKLLKLHSLYNSIHVQNKLGLLIDGKLAFT